jgi:6-phosphogluconolactonase
MKLTKLRQLFLVSMIGLMLASLLTACQLVTIDYVFVAASGGNNSAGTGQIYEYDADAESGALRNGRAPVASGGSNPVAMAVTPDYYNLYVANADNNTVVHFNVSDVGVLTQKDTVTLSATPVSLAVSPANNSLFVVSGTTSATLTEYSLSSGTIGSVVATVQLAIPGYGTDTIVPTGVTVEANGDSVYATAYDQSAYNPGGSTTSNANPGWLFSFAIGSSGALTPASDSPYQAGVKPSAVATDPTSRFVYVTDFASNELIGYIIYSGSNLNFMDNGPFPTGSEPSSVTIDPRGIYIYVANQLASTVSGYSISLPNGTPSAVVNVTGSPTNSTYTQPVSIVVEPSLGRYVYTANELDNSVSGFRLNPNTGVLTLTQATPYPTGNSPTAVIAVPHGNHATQTVQP